MEMTNGANTSVGLDDRADAFFLSLPCKKGGCFFVSFQVDWKNRRKFIPIKHIINSITSLVPKSVEPRKDVQGYHRALNLGDTLTTVRYKKGGIHFTREAFASAPDQLLKLLFTKGGGTSITPISFH